MNVKRLILAAAAALVACSALCPQAHAERSGATEQLKQDKIKKKVLEKGLASDARPIPLSEDQQLNKDRLEQILIAELDFNEASIEDAIDFLRAEARKSKQLVNFVYEPPKDGKPAPLTLQAQNISGTAFLDLVVKQAGLKYRIGDRAIVVYSPGGERCRKWKWVLNPMIAQLAADEYQATSPSPSTRNEYNAWQDEALIAFFKSYGIKFPKGSSLHYSRDHDFLTVSNTEENQHELNKVLLKKGKAMMKKAKKNAKQQKRKQRGWD